jgi:hypothetical protein
MGSAVQVSWQNGFSKSSSLSFALLPLPPAKMGLAPPAAVQAAAQSASFATFAPKSSKSPPRVQKQQVVVGWGQTQAQLSASKTLPSGQAARQVSRRAQ